MGYNIPQAPFDTTRWVLVRLNNPCCSIKFADELPQDCVSELKGPKRKEQGNVLNEEPSERNEMGRGRKEGEKKKYRSENTFFPFSFFMSKTAADSIYRDSDSTQSLADQYITAGLFDISWDGGLHLRLRKCKKQTKKCLCRLDRMADA